MEYDYFQLTLGRERTAQRSLADKLYASGGVRAVFAPLLGFASDQALVLAARETRVSFTPGVAASNRWRLTPTLRPAEDAPPEAGGIYVHNWFTIDGEAVEEFVRLSGEAWPDFEARFDTRIYGLFLAEEDEADRAAGQRRLLLMTRYRDLANGRCRAIRPATPCRCSCGGGN